MKAEEPSAGRAGKLKSRFKSQRLRLGVGLTLSIVAVTMLILLISFLRTGSLDESLVSSVGMLQMADAPEGVANAGGAFGAKVSHWLFVDGLGVGIFVVIFYIGWLALALFGVLKVRFWLFTFKCLFTAVALSIVIGLFTYNSDSFIHWGGNHGRYVNMWLYHVSDVIGAYAVSVFLICMLVVIYLHYIKSIYSNTAAALSKRREQLVKAAEESKPSPASIQPLPDSEDEGDTTGVDEIEVRRDPIETSTSTPNLHGFTIDGSTDATVDETQGDRQPSDADEPVFSINKDGVQGNEGTDFGDITDNDFEPYDIRDELSHYRFPSPNILTDRPVTEDINIDEQNENKDMIVKTLRSYDIEITHIEATIGPTVTRYEIVPAEGERIARIKRLEDDIARSLAALGIRIIAPIPGKDTIGIEVPNRNPQMVSMRSIVNSKKFRECSMALPMALGKTITNDIFIADLVKMPHLLVAGGSGQGKSVGMHAIITSLLYKKHPGELKFVLIDPKQLEFSLYNKLENHYLAKLPDEEEAIVTDPSKAVATLSSICVEMDNRYSMLKDAGVRTIEEYNRKFCERRLNPQKGHSFMPYIVVIVDEFADLISTAGKDILLYIGRIAAKARAAGIHMIIATQRPSTDVITGVIKSNFLGRIAFRVVQMVDSRTILDQPGANRLIGNGDMLFSHNSKMERVQCAFIETSEVDKIVDHIDSQIGYGHAYLLPEPENDTADSLVGAVDLTKRDELFDDCARFVCQNEKASTSSLQRRFGIGYNKAGKIMDQLEAAGVVGPADGAKPRSVLMDSVQIESLLRSL